MVRAAQGGGELTDTINRSSSAPLDAAAEGGGRRVCFLLIVALVLAGEVCRLGQYLSNQAMASAETTLLDNLRHRAALTLPFVRLDDYPGAPEAAPAIFLWETQWMARQFHDAEWAVRLLPLICAVAALPLFAWMAWEVVGPAAAVWAVAMFALSDPLIYYGSSAKQYSGDVLTALLILWPACSVETRTWGRRLACTCAVGAVGLWFSYTAVFPLAAAAVVFALGARGQGWRGARRLWVFVFPGVSFLAVYFFSMRVQRTNSLDMQWIDLIPNYARPLSIPGWAVARTWELFQFLFYPAGQVMIVGFVAGVWQLLRKQRGRFVLLMAGPVALDMIAGLARAYIYGGSRVTIFLAPGVILLIAVGAAALPELLRGWGRILQAGLLAYVLVMAACAGYLAIVPRNEGNLRDALRFLDAHRQTGEQVWLVGRDSTGMWGWYRTRDVSNVHLQDDARVPITAQRFWMVLAYNPRKFHKVEPALTQPGRHVVESRSLHIDGADVVWFEPSP